MTNAIFNLLEIKDDNAFKEALEASGLDREQLRELKNELIDRLTGIKCQLTAMDMDGRGVTGSPQDWARIHTTRKMLFVDRQFAKFNKEGGFLLFVSGPNGSNWHASRISPSDWVIREVTEYGDQAREISCIIPVTQDNWDRIPAEVERTEA